MVFSAVTFLFLFLPIFLAGYFLAGRRFRNLWLLGTSLGFYMWGSGALVWILGFSTTLDFVLGRQASDARKEANPRRLRLIVATSVAANIGLLVYFKYANFFIDQVVQLGILSEGIASITLPVGISFFTFQSMSYTIDIARGRCEPLKNPLDFALYVAMFPQLIAGPIVRFHEISDEIRSRTVNLDMFTNGVTRFAHGMAKKVLIADSVAPIADAAFGAGDLAATSAWVGIAAYTVQIYFDFSGYSDMAIGLGLMLGFHFPENFKRPYSAVSITDFWRRWHITLSNWFRDYVYIPLGGSRASSSRTVINLWTVFVLTGIWHGANWTFLAWGMFHGALLVAERFTGQRVLEERSVARQIARRCYVVLAVMIGWVLFRSASLGAAIDYLAAMFTGGGERPADFDVILTNRAQLALALGLSSMAVPASFVTGKFLTDRGGRLSETSRWIVVAGCYPLALVTVASGSFSPFLYFQF